VAKQTRVGSLTDLQARWNEIAQRLLLNRKIVEVRYMNCDECAQEGWSGQGSIQLKLDNGTILRVSADDEGNGPGALFCFEAPSMVLTSLPVCPAPT
jgi:hypothetical protein